MVSIEIWFTIFMSISVALGLLTLNWLITFIILYKKHVTQILARYPMPVILCSIYFSIQQLITTPMAMTINGILIKNKSIRYPALDITYTILYTLTIGGISWLFIYRVWMIYYDIQWNIALEDAEWQLHIDAYLKPDSNWFLRKKNSCGNWKKCAFILFIIWIVFSIAIVALVAINGLEKHKTIRYVLGGSQMYLFTFIFCITIACKLPPFNDIYSLRKEVKYLLMIWICSVTLFLVSAAFLDTQHGTVDYGIFHLEASVWLSVLSYILIPWSLKQCHLPTNVCSAFRYNIGDEMHLKRHFDDNERSELSYLNILKDYAGFRAYAQHLSKSYAIENLLFILEMYQFKKKMKSLFEREYNSTVVVGTDHMEITAKAPKSTLVEHMDNMDVDAKERVCICMSLLFIKYIPSDAYFCVNISYKTRKELMSNFGYRHNHDQQINIIDHIKHNKSEEQL